MKPKLGIPQLWFENDNDVNRDILLILYPDGSSELFNSAAYKDEWSRIFTPHRSQKDFMNEALQIKEIEFIGNIE